MKQVWGMVAVVCVLAGSLYADNESDGRRYLDEIDGLLDGIASELERVPGDSSTSYVESAVRKADEVKDKARRVYDLRGADDRARRYGERYPGYADKFKEAAGYLRQLKDQQRSLDALPRQCEDKQKELADKIRRFTDANNPDGLEAIPRLGRESGRPIREAVEQADRRKSELESWRDRAKGFSDGDDKWSNVRGKLHGAADAIYDHWKRTWEQAKRDCNDLIKEERNPVVETGLRLLADGEKVRQELYRELDKQLDDAARAVDDLERDSNESDVDVAARAADAIQSYLDRLGNAKGDDRRANELVRSWPRYTTAFREALKALRTLKQGQFIVDKAPGVCKDAEDRLRETIKRIVDPLDHDQRDQIPLIARNLGKSIEDKLQAAAQHDAAMRSARDAVKGFSISDGKWRDVATKLKQSADGIYKYWDDALKAARAACDELAKGDGHKDVVRAMKALDVSHSTTETGFGRAEADHRKWYEQIKELREWYKQDTRNVRDLFCSVDESVGDSAEGDAYAAQLAQIADRMRGHLEPRWNELVAESRRLLAVLNELKKAPEQRVRERASVLHGKLDRTVSSLVNLMNDELKGANDPEVRMMIETGKHEHKRIQSDSSKCEVAEVAIPGASMRMDCVRVASNTCYIVEIKPNNSSAISKGRSRAGDYQKAMVEFYRSNKSRIKDSFTGKLEVFLRCIANNNIALDAEVRAYDLCPPDGKLFRDFIVVE